MQKRPKLDVDQVLLGDTVVPWQDLLAFGPEFWDEDDDEFFPADDVAEEEPTSTPVASSITDGVIRARRKRAATRVQEEEDEDEDDEEEQDDDDDDDDEMQPQQPQQQPQQAQQQNIYVSSTFLDKFKTFFDVDDDDEYDFLDDVDRHADELRKDREDEEQVGRVDEDEVDFLKRNGGAPFLDAPAPNNRNGLKDTRSVVHILKGKRPVSRMNVPAPTLLIDPLNDDVDEATVATVQWQMDAHQRLLLQGAALARRSGNGDLVLLYESMASEAQLLCMGSRLQTSILERAVHQGSLRVMAEEECKNLLVSSFAENYSGGVLASQHRDVVCNSGWSLAPPRAVRINKAGAFHSDAQDRLMAWALSRLYTPDSYHPDTGIRWQPIQEHYFPLWSLEVLRNRMRSRTANNASENVLKEWMRNLKTHAPWTDEERCLLLLWSRMHPEDKTFALAQQHVTVSMLKMRNAVDMAAERERLRASLPTREMEDAFLVRNGRMSKPDATKQQQGRSKFDKEEIDSSDSEEDENDEEDVEEDDDNNNNDEAEENKSRRALLQSLQQPWKHPRADKSCDWTQDEDRLLLSSLREYLKPKSPTPPQEVVQAVAEKIQRQVNAVDARFKIWAKAYNIH